MITNKEIGQAMTIKLDATLPPNPVFEKGIRRAPSRGFNLTKAQTETALKNRTGIPPAYAYCRQLQKNNCRKRCHKTVTDRKRYIGCRPAGFST